jgi:4,5-DOPA dioxygenase extradiol
MGTAEKMPILFLGHGSPMNAIEENEFVEGFRQIVKTIQKPTAVLCISAHWETNGTHVTTMEKPRTIHDFYGFPPKLYEVEYPAFGSPRLAKEIKSIVTATEVSLDYKWGLDHGCWIVVKHLFPNADVPVLQMSLDYNKNGRAHYELGKQLSPLRKKGVLVIGSGNIVHNLGLAAWDQIDSIGYGYDWTIEANEKMKKYVLSDDHQQLINYRSQGRAFDIAIPTAEHYLPLLYVLALKDKDEEVTIFNDKAVAGSLTMTSIRIGTQH